MPQRNVASWLLIGLLSLPGPATAATLKQAVERALSSSPDVLEVVNRRLAVDEELSQARAGYYPSVDLNAGFGYEYTDNPTTRALDTSPEQLNRRELGLNVRQMLYDGRGTESEVARQQARVDSSAYRVYGTAEDTGLRVVQAYLDVLRYREAVALSDENLKTHLRIQDQIKLRSDAGVGRRADLDQIRARVGLAESNQVAARVNLVDAETAYNRVVGVVPVDLEAVESLGRALPTGLEEALEVALVSHPQLRQADADVEAAKAQYDASRQNLYPRFDLELGSNLNDNIDGRPGYDNDIQAMVRMRYNLYRGGGDEARIRQTAHQINEAKQVRNRTRRQVEEAVRLAWAALEATRRQLDSLKQHVEFSEKTRDAYAKQFNIGRRTLLDVLNIENELFQARLSYANAYLDMLFAERRVFAGMGLLLEKLEVGVPEAARVSAAISP